MWHANIDAKGRIYYYNTQSKKAVWKLPKKARLQDPALQDVRTKKAVLLVSETEREKEKEGGRERGRETERDLEKEREGEGEGAGRKRDGGRETQRDSDRDRE